MKKLQKYWILQKYWTSGMSVISEIINNNFRGILHGPVDLLFNALIISIISPSSM